MLSTASCGPRDISPEDKFPATFLFRCRNRRRSQWTRGSIRLFCSQCWARSHPGLCLDAGGWRGMQVSFLLAWLQPGTHCRARFWEYWGQSGLERLASARSSVFVCLSVLSVLVVRCRRLRPQVLLWNETALWALGMASPSVLMNFSVQFMISRGSAGSYTWGQDLHVLS